MHKANSDAITKLGMKNHIEADNNRKKIEALEKENAKEKDDIANLKAKEAIENKDLQNEIGQDKSAIKAI